MYDTDSEPVAMTPAERTAAHYNRIDWLDSLCGASSPWTDLCSEGIPANPPADHLEPSEHVHA